MTLRVSFVGGKQPIFRRIVNLMPPHRVYIESHLGGGAVLRAKRPAALNVGVDRDQQVLTRFENFPENFRFVCGDAIEALEALRPGPDALIYCDPPYLASTRRSPRPPYRYDLSEADHARLLAYLRGLSAAVMISSYPCELYRQMLAGWHRVEFVSPSRGGPRQEVLWMNFTPGGPLHDTRFLGDTFRERESFHRRRRRWTQRYGRMSRPEQQAILTDLLAAFHAGISPAQADAVLPLLSPSLSGEAANGRSPGTKRAFTTAVFP